MEDLELLAAFFITDELPADKEYLRKYFKTELQKKLVIYYLTFPYIDGFFKRYYHNFCDHTGIICCERMVYKLINKVHKIENRLKKAEKDHDHETVALIKSGMCKKEFRD